ncbi:MAG: flavodoxin domain-containing protein [Rhizobiaceae bacterium]
MHVLIAYGTVEGQTRKIARHMSGSVQTRGHDVTIFDAGDLEDIDMDMFDAAIIAAPVHIGAFPSAITEWIGMNSKKLGAIPSAFVSVSLAAASGFPEEHVAIGKIANDMFNRTKWKPDHVHHAAGALRYTKYDFMKRMLMKYIARKEGGSTDTSEDHEYTDWDALDALVGELLQQAKAAA